MTPFRRTLLLTFVIAAVVQLAEVVPTLGEGRPNVIFICADDLNTNLGCYGDRLVKSPNVDSLAAHGVRFDRAYCQYSVCNASRTSFLSGRRPGTTRIIDNATPPRTYLGDVVFLPQHFRQHGYRTLKVGKIFHTGKEFEDPRSWDLDIPEGRAAKNPPAEQIASRREKKGIILNCDDSQTWDGFVARRSIELLKEAVAGGQPFFLAIGFRRPHEPYIAPKRYHDMYPTSAVTPLTEPPEHLAKIPKWALTYTCGEERLSPSERPDAVASYAASISFMDAQLGLILDAVDRKGLWNNTVLVFLSDHGYHLGEHGGLWHKMTTFEVGTRVPLIIAAPGQAAGARSQLVELIDLYPTLCDLCGLPVPSGLEGQSLEPILRSPNAPGKPAVFTVVGRRGEGLGAKVDPNSMGNSVRTSRWRYTEWFDGGRELYDYDHDPHEYHNLADDPAYRQTASELAAMLASLKPPIDASENRHERVAERRKTVHIICHRGSSEHAHENTLEAFRATFELGGDGNEFDIRVTKDGVLVVFHDDMLDHLLEAYGNVSDYTWDELQRFRFRDPGLFGEQCRIPTLAEVFDLHRRYAGLMHLDIKVHGIDRPIADLLTRTDMWDQVAFCNEETGGVVLHDPRFQRSQYKASLYLDRGEVFPDVVAAALKRQGTGLILEEPTAAALALGRKLDKLSKAPVSPRRSLKPSQDAPLPSEGELIAALRNAEGWDHVAETAADRAASSRRIRARARAADQVLDRHATSEEAFAALEERVRKRSLHKGWLDHGVDGASALRALILLGAPQAVDVARFAFYRDDPALDPVIDPRWKNPRPWTDFRVKMVIFPALEKHPSAAAAKLSRDYLALSDEAARKMAPPEFEAAARTLLAASPRTETALELMHHRLQVVRGRAILDCLKHIREPWALAALENGAPFALRMRTDRD